MIALWDTTGNEVVKALAAERRSAGGVASGLALTLVVVVDEKRVREAEAAATIAAAAHPCRLLIVVRADVERPSNRLDAEIVVGGRLGPCEAVVMRMYGRLALHAESVVMPLLAPDVPVVTWWHGEPPEKIANDPLGVVADRRITDVAQTADPVAALRQRAARLRARRHRPRLDPDHPVAHAGRVGLRHHRGAAGRRPDRGAEEGPDRGADVGLAGREAQHPAALGRHRRVPDDALGLPGRRQQRRAQPRPRATDTATFNRTDQIERLLPLVRRPLGEELAEELRRLDPDQVYAAALAAMTGETGLDTRPAHRVHVWKDPVTAGHAPGLGPGIVGGGPPTQVEDMPPRTGDRVRPASAGAGTAQGSAPTTPSSAQGADG